MHLMAPFSFGPRRAVALDARAWYGICACDFDGRARSHSLHRRATGCYYETGSSGRCLNEHSTSTPCRSSCASLGTPPYVHDRGGDVEGSRVQTPWPQLYVGEHVACDRLCSHARPPRWPLGSSFLISATSWQHLRARALPRDPVDDSTHRTALSTSSSPPTHPRLMRRTFSASLTIKEYSRRRKRFGLRPAIRARRPSCSHEPANPPPWPRHSLSRSFLHLARPTGFYPSRPISRTSCHL